MGDFFFFTNINTNTPNGTTKNSSFSNTFSSTSPRSDSSISPLFSIPFPDSNIPSNSLNNNNNISSSNTNSDSPQQVHEKHPLAYHTSRILDEEITKLNLKSNDSLLSDLDINSII